MDLSCIIITNGKKPVQTNRVINSIISQNIPNFEIIISGIWKQKGEYKFVNAKKAADSGNLAEMRNLACSAAKFDNILVLDDDMFLSEDWYSEFTKYGNDFDILTSRVKLPDGTRFWDHCCYLDPERGHVMLEPEEDSDYIYMSGGMAWVMKRHVFERLQWDSETYGFYNMSNMEDYRKGKHNEDTDFALRCRESGFKIKHNHKMVSFHDDAKYTSVGRVVRYRRENRSQNWVTQLNWENTPEDIAKFAESFLHKGMEAECADVLRYGLRIHFGNFFITIAYQNLLSKYGGILRDSVDWYESGCPLYNKMVKKYG